MTIRTAALALAATLTAAAPALAQSAATQRTPLTRVLTGHPQRDTILRLSRPITVDLRDQRLEDVLTFIAELTEADLTPLSQRR